MRIYSLNDLPTYRNLLKIPNIINYKEYFNNELIIHDSIDNINNVIDHKGFCNGSLYEHKKLDCAGRVVFEQDKEGWVLLNWCSNGSIGLTSKGYFLLYDKRGYLIFRKISRWFLGKNGFDQKGAFIHQLKSNGAWARYNTIDNNTGHWVTGNIND